MSHCVAGVPPVVACGVVPLDVANSITGFPRLLPLLRDFQAIKSPNTRMIIIVRRGKEKQPSSAAFPSPFCSKFN